MHIVNAKIRMENGKDAGVRRTTYRSEIILRDRIVKITFWLLGIRTKATTRMYMMVSWSPTVVKYRRAELRRQFVA